MSDWMRRLVSVPLVGMLVVACGTSTTSTGPKPENTQPLTVAVFNPFTGPDAAFGPNSNAGCFPVSAAIQAVGGILGHKQYVCEPVDTRGDPADAVPAAQKAIATLSDLVAVLGPSSDEASATAPLFEAAKIPMMADTGEVSFDHTNLQYFWRDTPSDDYFGYGMALYAHDMGWTTAAAVFASDIGSQGTVPTVTSGFTKLGGTIVANETLAVDQSSYRSEVEKVIAAQPQVIFNEMDPQTASVFFAELRQLSGKNYPMIAIGGQYTDWVKAVTKAVGADNLSQSFHTVVGSSSTTGEAYDTWSQYLKASSAKVPDYKQWTDDPYAQANYDGLIAFALAMVAAKTTDNSVWNSYVFKVTTPSPGAVVVHTFEEGLTALNAGKTIDYVGVTGQMGFSKWHNSGGGFQVLGYSTVGTSQPVLKTYSPQDILQVANQ
jgi:ABC-type branched-subunit amino acid transport system substrate-binding protein